jgi:hypothetical protein
MFRIKNLDKVKNQLSGLLLMVEEAKSSGGKDIVKTVKENLKPEGAPISEEALQGEPRPALFEAVYRGESAGEEKNAQEAKKIMSQKEQNSSEQETIDRFARDFLKHISRKINE